MQLRKAIVMAGGKATRLYPLTHSLNKHILPIYNRPMIHWVIQTLVDGGITDIMVLLNNHFAQQIIASLQSGEEFGCSISYGYEREVAGVTKQILWAQNFIGADPFVLMLGDSLYLKPLSFQDLETPSMWTLELSTDFDDFKKYPEVTVENGFVTGIVEKPTERKTGIIQAGTMAFSSDVFEIANRLTRNAKSEVQMRTLAHEYIRVGRLRSVMLPPDSFLDLGTHNALLRGANLIAKREQADPAIWQY